jgi:hypothetical protein
MRFRRIKILKNQNLFEALILGSIEQEFKELIELFKQKASRKLGFSKITKFFFVSKWRPNSKWSPNSERVLRIVF